MSEITRLTYEDMQGIFSIMPTPATPDGDDIETEFSVDLEETERAANALVEDGVDAIMLNGTFGEAATLSDDEWKQFTKTVVETVDGRVPAIAGPTTLDTRSTIKRAKYARGVGADGVMLGRPMWVEMSQKASVQFYKDIARSVPELGIVVYDNPGAFKNRLEKSTYERLADIPQVVGAKYGRMGLEYRDVYASVGDRMQLMPLDKDWFIARLWFPDGVPACWSPSASCDPLPVVKLKEALYSDDDETARELSEEIAETYKTFFPGDDTTFHQYNVTLEKERMNAAGYLDAGPVRPPYHIAPDDIVAAARQSGRDWKDLVERVAAEQ